MASGTKISALPLADMLSAADVVFPVVESGVTHKTSILSAVAATLSGTGLVQVRVSGQKVDISAALPADISGTSVHAATMSASSMFVNTLSASSIDTVRLSASSISSVNIKANTNVFIGTNPGVPFTPPTGLSIVGSSGNAIAGIGGETYVLVRLANEGDVGLMMHGSNSGTEHIYFGYSGANGNIKGGLSYVNANDRMVFRTAGTDHMTLTSGGILQVPTISASSIFVNTLSASSVHTAHIKFPATQASSADVNTLDDYEEGVFTPTISYVSPGDLAVTYSSQIGTYTKIGNRVMVDINISTTSWSHSTASGAEIIGNLPFIVGSSGSYEAVGSLGYSGLTKANYTTFNMRTNGTNNLITIRAAGSGQPSTFVSAADAPSGTNQVRIGSLSYLT